MYLENALHTLDGYNKAFLLLWGSNRWLAARVEVIGALVSLLVGVSIAWSKAKGSGIGFDAGWSGLCLNYASMFTEVLTVR